MTTTRELKPEVETDKWETHILSKHSFRFGLDIKALKHGWIVRGLTTRETSMHTMAAFSTFPEMIKWLQKEHSRVMRNNKPKAASKPDRYTWISQNE